MGRDLERQLATEDRQMASKHVRRHSQPFVTMELQIRTRRCHHTQIKRGGGERTQNKTKTSQNCQHQMRVSVSSGRDCWARLVMCGVVQPPWKTVWHFLTEYTLSCHKTPQLCALCSSN